MVKFTCEICSSPLVYEVQCKCQKCGTRYYKGIRVVENIKENEVKNPKISLGLKSSVVAATITLGVSTLICQNVYADHWSQVQSERSIISQTITVPETTIRAKKSSVKVEEVKLESEGSSLGTEDTKQDEVVTEIEDIESSDTEEPTETEEVVESVSETPTEPEISVPEKPTEISEVPTEIIEEPVEVVEEPTEEIEEVPSCSVVWGSGSTTQVAINTFNMMPNNVRDLFTNLGWHIEVTDANLARQFGYSTSIMALTCYDIQTIYIASNNNNGVETIAHELGHFIDYRTGFQSMQATFSDIHTREVGIFKSFHSTHHANTDTPHEYFAEAFAVYIMNPTILQGNCPETYNFIQSMISMI